MVKDLAPSTLLHSEYVQDKTITWDQYVTRFISKIKNNPKALEALKKLKVLIEIKKKKTVTILCHCVDENQ
jgi:uncharacterized protein YeaO (DUF488 family)